MSKTSEMSEFIEGVAKCDLGANAQLNFIIEKARELEDKWLGGQSR